MDLSTQQLYQHLDARFIGLIVSAFDKSRGKIGLIAFQSGAQAAELCIPVHFLPHSSDPCLPLVNMVKLVQIQASEERESYCLAVGAPDTEGRSGGQAHPVSDASGSSSSVSPHPLVSLFAAATYQRSLVRLLEIQVAPVITALDEQLRRSTSRLADLTALLLNAPS